MLVLIRPCVWTTPPTRCHLFIPAQYLPLLSRAIAMVTNPVASGSGWIWRRPHQMHSGIKLCRFTSHSPAATRESGSHVSSDLIAADECASSPSGYFPLTLFFPPPAQEEETLRPGRDLRRGGRG